MPDYEKLIERLNDDAGSRDGWPDMLEYEAAEAISTLLKEMEWRSIETAPKDGTRVLLWADGEHKIARWFTAEEHAFYEHGHAEDSGLFSDMWMGDTGEENIEPEAWQPLPAPPAKP